jgi:hypothetical protein
MNSKHFLENVTYLGRLTDSNHDNFLNARCLDHLDTVCPTHLYPVIKFHQGKRSILGFLLVYTENRSC